MVDLQEVSEPRVDLQEVSEPRVDLQEVSEPTVDLQEVSEPMVDLQEVSEPTVEDTVSPTISSLWDGTLPVLLTNASLEQEVLHKHLLNETPAVFPWLYVSADKAHAQSCPEMRLLLWEVDHYVVLGISKPRQGNWLVGIEQSQTQHWGKSGLGIF